MATGVSEAVEVAKPTLVDAVDIFQGILEGVVFQGHCNMGPTTVHPPFFTMRG
jgi:hypothetical protein